MTRMRKAIGCLLLAVMCLLGSLYLPRILQEIQTDQDQQNLISGYVRNPDTTTSEETDGIDNSDEPASENNPYVERSIDFPNLQQINPEIFAWITVPGTPIDYPVALGEDNNYYLYHSVTGESNMAKGWITAEDVAKAKEIIATVSAEKAANMPEQMIQNIAKGRLGKFLKEVCLLNQEDIMDAKKTVREVLKEADPELKVVDFKRFTLRAE